MTIYYVKQDNSIWGCNDPDCCGENYETIEHSYVDCQHDDVTDLHLREHAIDGGEILEWREANELEKSAFYSGIEHGTESGFDWGIDYENKRIIKLLSDVKTNEEFWAGIDFAIALIKGETK